MTDSAAPGDLHIQLLGVPRWEITKGATGLLSAQEAALLAFLALAGPQPREVIAGRLWPLATQERAAYNLRKHIERLRGHIVGHRVVRTGATIALADNVHVDVAEASGQEAPTEPELLAGFAYPNNAFLQRWVDQRRKARRSARADALAARAELLERRRELAEAIGLAEQIVELVPSHEHAWRRLMRLHYLRADHTAAIAAFERFERLLREETGARPGSETRDLLSLIERGARALAMSSSFVPVALARPPLCIGRSDTWDAMERAWASGRTFLLVGDAGMGKSRLLGDFASCHEGLLIERARAGDSQSQNEVLVRTLRQVLAAFGPALDEDARMQLARLLPELATEPKSVGSQARVRRAAEAALTAAVGRGLVGLLIDDLQFADLASLEALRWLSAGQALSGLRFGFAARSLDDGAEGALLREWLVDSQPPEEIRLRPLSRDQVAELLDTLGLPGLETPGLAMRLHAHTAGRPLFVLETLKLALRGGGQVLSGDLPVPPTVQALLERRLHELPQEAIALVQVAAIAGDDLTAERAAALLRVSPLDLVDAWAILDRADVLRGTHFSHDLMRDCALGLVPAPLRGALHARVAEQLVDDETVPPARIAAHWAAAERWGEAGAWWYRAGMAARRAGRLHEQRALLEKSAACHRQAGNVDGEFEAVRAGFDSLLLCHGAGAALSALPRLEALATQRLGVLHCRLIEAEALVDLERAAAVDVAAAAARLATGFPMQLGDALCLHAMALAQQGRPEEAVTAGRQAAAAARTVELPEQEMRAVRALAYVLYQNGQIGEALPVQSRALELANALGDAAEVAAAEGSIAALYATAGDVARTLDHARRAHHLYAAMGLQENSTPWAANLICLGRAAAYGGFFEESLEALGTAERMAGDGAQVGIQARSRIMLATVHLTLGSADQARRLVANLPAGSPPGMRMQAALVAAQADRLEGRSGAEHFARLGRLGEDHPELPMVMSAWIEWSYQGEAAKVVRRLAQLRVLFDAAGRSGTARTLLIRQVARLNDMNGLDAMTDAARHAAELLPHVGISTCAAMYPPEAWSILARAFERCGNYEARRRCRKAAKLWIEERALLHVPVQVREAFLNINPFNREFRTAAD